MATLQDINEEINRIDAAKAAIIAAIEAKGVEVPEDAMIQDLIEQIPDSKKEAVIQLLRILVLGGK